MGAAEPTRALEPADIEEIHGALVAAYGQMAQLDRRLAHKWGVRLGREIDTSGGTKAVYQRLIDWTEEEGRTLELLALAWTDKPGNRFLDAAARRLIPDRLEAAAALYGQGRLPDTPATLEAVVSARSRLMDFREFEQRLQALKRAICKVETPAMTGTGFLVGRQAVLTNFHVVEAVATAAPLTGVACRFDYLSSDAGDAAVGMAIAVASDGILQTSPYSQSDTNASGSPGANELDFALLRLANPVEADRPSLALPDRPKVVIPGDVALIAQHPGGATLNVALGKIVEFPASGLRYRYDVTTEGGSSGAPVFSADLDLIGLHHAAEPTQGPRFNQAIPIFLVAEALRGRGVVLGGL